MDATTLFAVIGVIVLVGIGIAVAVYVRRQQYIKSLTSRGWQFVDRPSIAAAHGLNCPPFGLGDNRRVDDQVTGRTRQGTPFQAFEYDSTTHGDPGYVVTVPLPRSMPEFYHFPTDRPRAGAQGVVVHQDPAHTVVAKDPEYGRAVLAAIAPTLAGYPVLAQLPRVDLSIDHDQLVAVGVPKEAEQLEVQLEAMAETARAIAQSSALQAYQGPDKPPRLSVYGHPGWEYRTRDDSLLNRVQHRGGGQNHRAENCLLSSHPMLPFVALTHRWETTRTVTETDSEGRTRTRTVTDHHEEELVEFHPQFSFADFKVNRGLMGDRVQFEWHQFNEAFTVRCASPRFASDVFHQRMMEYLMACRPLPFELTAGRIEVGTGVDVTRIAFMEEFLLGFFARVPNFVWENLGHSRPPIPVPAA